MASDKQRSVEIKAKRALRAEKKLAAPAHQLPVPVPNGCLHVSELMLAPYSIFGVPTFIERGYYLPLPFKCHDCGGEEVWSAKQQKWWYETARASVYSTAIRCRACRVTKRASQAHSEAMRLAGVVNKQTSKNR